MKLRSFVTLFFLAAFLASAIAAQGPGRVFYQDVQWSPDGKRLAYSQMTMATVDGKHRMETDVWVVNADGTGRKKVTTEGLNQYYVSWAPDGNHIAFGAADPATRLSDIYIEKADGSGSKKLTDGKGRNSQPSISPDGKFIVFASTRDASKYQIYTMRIDGSDLKRLTKDDSVAYFNPQWSPDGKRITYYAEKGDRKDQVWTIGADGSDPKLLTNNVGHNIFPGFTSEGRIIFCSNRDGERGAVYTMAPDGSDIRRVEGIESSWARYSPDGKKIAWVDVSQPKPSIYVADLDLSNKKLVAGPGNGKTD